MKKLIVAVIIIMVLIPISYLSAEDKETVDPVKNEKVMSSKGYLSLPAKNAYYIFKERMTKETDKANFLDCIDGQKRIISHGRMSAGNEETKPDQGYHSTFWVTIQCEK